MHNENAYPSLFSLSVKGKKKENENKPKATHVGNDSFGLHIPIRVQH